jgi:hypothetical protein
MFCSTDENLFKQTRHYSALSFWALQSCRVLKSNRFLKEEKLISFDRDAFLPFEIPKRDKIDTESESCKSK